MINVIIIDLAEADGINEVFIEDSRIDESVQQILQFFSIIEGCVHLVRFFLQGSHLVFYRLQMVLKIKEDVF